MKKDEDSFEKVNYLFRLKKQIERKMMIELLSRLGDALPIKEYRYIGFGSIYFADFILFHKYLHVRKMTSLEKRKKKEARFKYNRPYKFVKLVMRSAGDFMRTGINWDEPLIMWLDYDSMIDDEILGDVEYFSEKAREGHLLFVTVEAEAQKNEKEMKGFLEAHKGHVGDLVPDFARRNFPLVASRIIRSAVHEGLRTNLHSVQAMQLLNVTYEDTKAMYTYGCLFCSKDATFVEQCNVEALEFVTQGDNLYPINCPLLTPREKYHLDAHINDHGICTAGLTPTGLTDEQRKSYAEFYKYYPQFFESIY